MLPRSGPLLAAAAHRTQTRPLPNQACGVDHVPGYTPAPLSLRQRPLTPQEPFHRHTRDTRARCGPADGPDPTLTSSPCPQLTSAPVRTPGARLRAVSSGTCEGPGPAAVPPCAPPGAAARGSGPGAGGDSQTRPPGRPQPRAAAAAGSGGGERGRGRAAAELRHTTRAGHAARRHLVRPPSPAGPRPPATHRFRQIKT